MKLSDAIKRLLHYLYAPVFVHLYLLISFEGKDLITNFTAVAATINNIGPGLEMAGPAQNFGHCLADLF